MLAVPLFFWVPRALSLDFALGLADTGSWRGPTETSGRRPRRKRCRFAIDPQVQYLLVEGTALGIYDSQALKGSDAAQPTGCSAPFVPCVTNETDYPLARWHKKRQKQTKRQHVASETVNPLATGEMYYIRISE